MRTSALPASLALIGLLSVSGCLGGPGAGDGPGGGESDPAGHREGVVFLNEAYTVSSVQPASLAAHVEAGARDVVLEIQMDSGVMPNLRVELTGCGAVEPASSGGWEAYPLCDQPSAGAQTLRITVQGVVVSPGSGRVLLRADLPSP